MAPDVVYHRSVSPDIITAAEAAQRAAEFKAAFPDVHVTVEFVTATDDTASVVWVAEGTHEGEFDGVAPTGQRATWEGISVLRIECGRVTEFWNQTDALGLRQQLGIVSDEELADAEPVGTGHASALIGPSTELATRVQRGATARHALQAVVPTQLSGSLSVTLLALSIVTVPPRLKMPPP